MTPPLEESPQRLLASDVTAFERRVLEGALAKGPSPAASARMARALGVTVTSVGMAAAAKPLAAEALTSKATAATGTTVVWPWVSAGVVGLILAGAVVGSRAGRSQRESLAPSSSVTAPPSAAGPAIPAPPVVAVPPVRSAVPAQVGRTATAVGDLSDQVGFIDSAREAMTTGENRRALEILRRYQRRYPAGTFRPEALALEIEVLMKVGQQSEARALATRFLARPGGGLLARRVAEVAGLTEP